MITSRLKKCAQLYDLPPDIQAHEIYEQLQRRQIINILAVCKTVNNLNEVRETEDKFASKRCISIIEEYMTHSNRHLVNNVLKRDPRRHKLVDPKMVEAYESNPSEFAGNNPKKSLLSQKDKNQSGNFEEEKKENHSNLLEQIDEIENSGKTNKSSNLNSWMIFIYDFEKNLEKFMISDAFINNKLIEKGEPINFSYKSFDKFNQLEESFPLRAFFTNYENFDIGIIQKDPESNYTIFRQYWSLDNVEGYSSHPITFKNFFIHTSMPADSSLNELLTIDLVFQIEKELEIRATFTFQHIETYADKDKVYWIIHLIRHPDCYYYPLKPYEYRAFHMKNWRRVQNFFLSEMSDNIDKLYVASKSVVRLAFNKTIYEKKLFFKQYEARLKTFKRFIYLKEPKVACVNYITIPLKLNTKRIYEAKVPFDLKFLLMVMISRGQIDIYDYPENFLEKIWEGDKDNIRGDMKISIMEMIVNNKKFEKKYMSYSAFKEEFQKYAQVAKNKEKILSSDRASEFNIGSFDAIFLNFEVQISPSCIYYSCSDFEVSKSLYFQIQDSLKKFLLVKFIDETLETIQSVRYMLEEFYYKKFFQEISILGRYYEFFSFTSSQIENRSFWAYCPEGHSEKNKGYGPKSFFRPDGSINFKNLDRRLFEYSYDTLQIEDLGIKILEIDEVEGKGLMDLQDTSSRVLKYPFDGFVSDDILEKISNKFSPGYLPGIIIRSSNQEFLLLRDPDPNSKKSLRFHKDLLVKYKLTEVAVFDISEILIYRSAFLNQRIITLLESFYLEEFTEDLKDLDAGLKIISSKYCSDFLGTKDMNLWKRVILSSKNAHSALHPILTCSELFSKEIYFYKLNESSFTKSCLDVQRKLKIYTEFGAHLFGIFDPTGSLKEGEVYYDIENPFSMLDYQENAFPFVLVVRKPYLDHPEHRDVKIFKVNTNINNEIFKDLKNCLIFSSKDKDFVLGSGKNKDNYFLVFWDQHLLPVRCKKFPQKNVPNQQVRKNSFENKMILSELNNTNWFLNEKLETMDEQFQSKMIEQFQSLVKLPRKKDIRNLHLIYADLSKDKCQSKIATFLSQCYHEYYDLGDGFQTDRLRNILQHSRYKPIPRYFKEIYSLKHFVEKDKIISRNHSVSRLISLDLNLDDSEDSTSSIKSEERNENHAPASEEQKLIPGNFIDQDLVYEGYENYLKNGLQVLLLYKYDIQRLCSLYGCTQESDLYIGFNKRNDLNWKDAEAPRFARKFINLKDYFRTLTQKYERFFRFGIYPDGKEENNESEEKLKKKASAWYICSLYTMWNYDETLCSLVNNKELKLKPLLKALALYDQQEVVGLPWIAASEWLVKIKEERVKNN